MLLNSGHATRRASRADTHACAPPSVPAGGADAGRRSGHIEIQLSGLVVRHVCCTRCARCNVWLHAARKACSARCGMLLTSAPMPPLHCSAQAATRAWCWLRCTETALVAWSPRRAWRAGLTQVRREPGGGAVQASACALAAALPITHALPLPVRSQVSNWCSLQSCRRRTQCWTPSSR